MEKSKLVVSDGEGTTFIVNTKFKKGQTVYHYVRSNNSVGEIKEVIIFGILVKIKDTPMGSNVEIIYKIGHSMGLEFSENELYSSREEIKEWLHNKINNL